MKPKCGRIGGEVTAVRMSPLFGNAPETLDDFRRGQQDRKSGSLP